MARLDDYDYQLPPELIAQRPLPNRTDARLLVVRRESGEIEHAHVRDLPSLLRPSDQIVINNTQVVPARLDGRRTRTGGRWQGLFLEADDDGNWRLLSKTRGRLEPGETVTLFNRKQDGDTLLKMVTKLESGEWIARPIGGESAMDILDRVGRVPLPHYIRDGNMTDEDWLRYQTVYADEPGAVAAPTAGLHFTGELLQRLTDQGIKRQHVTLHVGAGTFRPITTEQIEDHQMHSEWASLSEKCAAELTETRHQGGRIVAIGTTSVRVLESASQSGQLSSWSGHTDLFIYPPYSFHTVDVLLTNFHLPRSTLLVLVRTFGGAELMKRAYQQAIEERYRFYSYGDAMIIM